MVQEEVCINNTFEFPSGTLGFGGVFDQSHLKKDVVGLPLEPRDI